MSRAAIARAHQTAREALNATGCSWAVTGVRMDYHGRLTLRSGDVLTASGKSQLDTMSELLRQYRDAQKAA